MTEEELLVDRYNRFRKIGEYREYMVKGARVDEAETRRKAAKGVYTKSGRWAEVRFWHTTVTSGHSGSHALCAEVLRRQAHSPVN